MNDDYTILKKENKYLEEKFKIKYDNEKKEYRLKNSDFSFFNGDFNKAKELGGVFINEISKIALKNSDFSFFNMDFNKAKELGAIYIEEIKKFVIKNSDFLFFSNVNSDEERKKVDDLKAFYIKDLKKYVIKYSILNKYNIRKWYKNPAGNIDINNINNASLMIGRKFENDLVHSMLNAQKRIYIISPYISDESIDFCTHILNTNKNIDFKIVTSLKTKDSKEYNKKPFKKLISVELDKSKEEEIQKIKNEIDSKYKIVTEKTNEIVTEKTNEVVTEKTNETPYQDDLNFFFTFIISILILLLFFNSKLLIIFSILFSLFYFFNRKNRKNKNDKNDKNKNDKNDKNNNNNVFYNRDKIESEIKNLQEKLKNYFVASRKISNLNFKVINDNFGEDFLHIKMYIIDDTVYLGSLNFTTNAFLRNIESLIKIENPDIAEELKKYFESLYENKDNKEYEFLDDISIAKVIYSYDDFFKNNQQNT